MRERNKTRQLSRRQVLKGSAGLLLCTVQSGFPGAVEGRALHVQSDPKRIYLAPDDHTDYFWTAGEDAYRQAFLDMIDYYLDQADATASNPSDFQSRWNCDGSYWIWTYEHNRMAIQFQRLVDRIRDGHISFPLNALVVCEGGAPAEAVLRGMYYAGRIERRHDLRVPVAIAMENQTLPYGLAALWAGAGARYSWKGICNCDTRVPSAWDRQNEIYWLQGSDGSRILMKWNSMLGDIPGVDIANQGMGGYAEARHPSAVVDYVASDLDFQARYPYRVIGAFGQGWDNFKTMDQACVAAAEAKSNETRRVIVSNQNDFFQDFESTYGSGLPSVSCSFGNEWDLYCAALSEVSARVKRSVEKLRGAEVLATLVSLQDPGFLDGRTAARDQAWMDLGLFWEHNWGMAGYPSDHPSVLDRVAWQKRLAGEIESYVDTLQADATSALGGMIQTAGSDLRFYALNPLSQARTDIADFPYSGEGSVHVIDLSTGLETPSQLVSVDGQQVLRVLAEDVPPVGYKAFEMRDGAGQSFSGAPTANASTGVMENDRYRLVVAPRGAITSLVDKANGHREFAQDIGGYGVNDLGPSAGTLAVENAGPVSVTLRASALSPLAHTTRITLFRQGVERIDVRNEITENFDDIVTWKYGFNLSAPDVWHEEVGAVIRAKLLSEGGHYSDRVENSRYDWLTLNHFADMSAGGVGVTLSNADCYFMKLGNSTISSLDTTTPQINALAGGRVANGDRGLPSQGGDTHFLQRFALKTHSAYDPVQSMKLALEHQNPLITGEITGGSVYPETSYSLLTISNPDVLLWALKPADDGIDEGIIARLWNLSSQPTDCLLALANGPIVQATRVTHIETPVEAAPLHNGVLVASLRAHQLKTWSLQPSGAGWPELPTPIGVSASDGTFPFWVAVSWDAVAGATSYEVWRHTSDDLGSATCIRSSITTTEYSDFFAVTEQVYYYWVRALNPYVTSEFSTPDTGWTRSLLPTDSLIYLPLVSKQE